MKQSILYKMVNYCITKNFFIITQYYEGINQIKNFLFVTFMYSGEILLLEYSVSYHFSTRSVLPSKSFEIRVILWKKHGKYGEKSKS